MLLFIGHMARGDILRKLFTSFSADEREAFVSAATELIEEEKSKNHTLLAHDLERILRSGNGQSKTLRFNPQPWNDFPEPPKDKETGLALLSVTRFDLTWEEIVLSDSVRIILDRVVLENRKQEILAAYGLKPKNKLLFCGPPGCGKTQTAKTLASVMSLPLVSVSLTAMFSSYLGETATNLQKIFDYINAGEWVILFDEFDAIARDRNTPNEHGEIKRLVNSLLQLIDLSESSNLFIAATNHENLLDTAVWRRFDEIILFERPSIEIREKLLAHYLSTIRYRGIDLFACAQQIEMATGADIERICTEAVKSVILRGDKELSADDLEVAIGKYIKRESIVHNSTKSGTSIQDE
jgi:SpoVK/Ycf46/Vps4 family AAA+-type ATPase